MKSTIEFLNALCEDLQRLTNTSMAKDLITIRSRLEKEGESFLTITLPTFAKGIERCLELGFFDPSLFRPFGKTKSHGNVRIPKLFSGIVSKLFDVHGSLLVDANPDLVDGLRQVCLCFNKLKKGCTDERQLAAIRSFRQCEADLGTFRPKTWDHLKLFGSVFNRVFGQVLWRLQCELQSGELVPAHGPGAVAEGFSNNRKPTGLTWSKRLERSFSIYDYALPNYGFSVEEVLHNAFESKVELPVKVIFVPKTQKTPRVIAIEPAHNQYIQQAVSRRLVELIESDPWCRGIHFTDNSYNREYARKSSLDRKYATLDLSEASDRVHAGLVWLALSRYPALARGIFDCRSKYALLPDGKTVGLKKFASMGSALCFPIESMVFYTICIMSGLKTLGLAMKDENVRLVTSHIHVFGDDLVVPTSWRTVLTDLLESARFKVNVSKSFSSGPFRESCGMDAMSGVCVTPVYIRKPLPLSKKDHSAIVSTVASANLFYKKGYWRTADYLRSFVEGFVGPLPYVADDSQSVGWHTFKQFRTAQRWNHNLHRFEHKGFVAKPVERNDPVMGAARLLKYFLRRGTSTDPIEVRDFNKSTVRESVSLKPRWIPA